MIIAQITDFHVRPPGVKAYGGHRHECDAAQRRRDDRGARSRCPTACSPPATSPIADCADEYREIDDALSTLPMPAFVIPGNHDRRDVMRASLERRHPYLRQHADFLQYVIDDFPVRLIGLDTVIAGEHGGVICAAREAWFAQALARAATARPTLVFMHHPPFRTGVPAMDPMMCRTTPGVCRT